MNFKVDDRVKYRYGDKFYTGIIAKIDSEDDDTEMLGGMALVDLNKSIPNHTHDGGGFLTSWTGRWVSICDLLQDKPSLCDGCETKNCLNCYKAE